MVTISLNSKHARVSTFQGLVKTSSFLGLLDSVYKKTTRETYFAFTVTEKDLKASFENYFALTSFI